MRQIIRVIYIIHVYSYHLYKTLNNLKLAKAGNKPGTRCSPSALGTWMIASTHQCFPSISTLDDQLPLRIQVSAVLQPQRRLTSSTVTKLHDSQQPWNIRLTTNQAMMLRLRWTCENDDEFLLRKHRRRINWRAVSMPLPLYRSKIWLSPVTVTALPCWCPEPESCHVTVGSESPPGWDVLIPRWHWIGWCVNHS